MNVIFPQVDITKQASGKTGDLFFHQKNIFDILFAFLTSKSAC